MRVAAWALLSAVLSGCGLHWPWRHRASAPQPVHELVIEAAGAASQAAAAPAAAPIPQFWDRNTLLLDLTAERGEGGATLRPGEHGWPVRLEFRVQPGSFGRLEVQSRDRVVFELPAQGGSVVLRLDPSAYGRDLQQLTLRWSAADGSER